MTSSGDPPGPRDDVHRNPPADGTSTGSSRVLTDRRELLGAVGHGLRTPLHAITGLLELLRNTELSPEQHAYVADARDNARALAVLVRDALDYAALVSGEMVLAPASINLRELLDGAVRAHAEAADASRLELVLDIDPSVPREAQLDSTRVAQVLAQLLDNAIRYTRHGEVVVQAFLQSNPAEGAPSAAAAATPHYLCINVMDTGPGMATHITERLQVGTLPASGSPATPMRTRRSATGLGLALAAALVKRMHGRMNIARRASRGTSASFAIPILEAPLEAGHLQPRRGAPLELVIYDANASARQAITSMARSLGADVLVANSFDEVYELASLPTLGVTRAVLVGAQASMDPLTPLLKRLNGDPATRTVPIALAAPASVAATASRALDLTALLTKPVTHAALRTALETLAARTVARLDPARPSGYANQALSGHVLLVDDTPNNQKIATSMLTRMGMTVAVAANGHEAVEAMRHGGIDLVLMDIQMPVMDGHQASRAIRALEGAPRVPIVAMTANAQTEDLLTVRDSGMDDFLTKPVRAMRLRDVVARWLRIAPALQAHGALRSAQADAQQPVHTEQAQARLKPRIDELLALVAHEDFHALRSAARALQQYAIQHERPDLGAMSSLIVQACQEGDHESAERYVTTLIRLLD